MCGECGGAWMGEICARCGGRAKGCCRVMMMMMWEHVVGAWRWVGEFCVRFHRAKAAV